MVGDEVLECFGCGGDTLLEPEWHDHEISQPWRGGMLLVLVDGRAHYVHDHPQCRSCTREAM